MMVTAGKTARGARVSDAGREALVEAVVMLRPPAGGRVPDPAESKAAIASALAKASESTGIKPDAVTAFESLHSFSVRAPKAFVDALARSSEVAQVLPNALPSSPLIEPVKKKSVKLPG